jgi:hypothetical protein
MKKLLFAVSALAALSLLAPSTGFAQHMYDNQLGLYMTNDGTGITGSDDIGSPIACFLVLTKPANAAGVPWTGIKGIELQLVFDPAPAGNLFKTGDALNGDGLNIGDVNNLANGYLEYIVGFAAEIPKVDEACLLVSFTFIHTVPGVINVFLGPITSRIPSLEDAMSFVSPESTLDEMYSSSGDRDAPIFTFGGGTVVPVEGASFGTVKALFR